MGQSTREPKRIIDLWARAYIYDTLTPTILLLETEETGEQNLLPPSPLVYGNKGVRRPTSTSPPPAHTRKLRAPHDGTSHTYTHM